MKKNIFFINGKLTPAAIGSALAGSNQKVDLMAFCNKVNSNCPEEFPDMKIKLELSLIRKQLSYKIILLTRELIKKFAESNTLTQDSLLKIINLKSNELNTNNLESAKKTIISFAKQIGVKIKDE